MTSRGTIRWKERGAMEKKSTPPRLSILVLIEKVKKWEGCGALTQTIKTLPWTYEKLNYKGEPYRFSDPSVQTDTQTSCYFIIKMI